jgi:DNA topoisomerase-3
MDVQQTLNVAQSLYERHKAITYPRSDCRYLPVNMHAEAPALLAAMIAAEPNVNHRGLNPKQRSRAWNDHKVSAHHAIIPTAQLPDRHTLAHEERRVYELIRAHYLAQFLPDHEYERTRVLLQCREVTLEARGKSVIETGWRTVFSDQHIPKESDVDEHPEQPLPALAVDAECTVTQADLRALKTTPPRRYTQGELIKAMKGIARWVTDAQLRKKLKETTGIGTEATRAGIINGLIARGYLVKERRSVRATDTAHELIQAVPAAIADPGTTALWEQALDRIAAGGLALEEFVHQQSAWVATLVRAHLNAAQESPAPLAPPVRYPNTGRPITSTRPPAKASPRTRSR